MTLKPFTLLALGDSYTIGENLALYDSFPYQTIQLLRKAGYPFNAPEIIAKNGWTTEELRNGIKHTIFQPTYHFVSLLIGVNDQYQGKDLQKYSTSLEMLIKQAISFAANKPDSVFVFSIPDWGRTPFAEGKDRLKIRKEINDFNDLKKNMAHQYKVNYYAVEDKSDSLLDPAMLADDHLHPSAVVYKKWALHLATEIEKLLA
ncbi:MAG: GDSL-type esterase/lipase family protein [Chitinophagaceae bacterium]